MSKKPLNAEQIESLQEGPERKFAMLFYQFQLNKVLDLFHERQKIVDEKTGKIALPDFEIVPKNSDEFPFIGGFVELAGLKLSCDHKNKQRQAVLGWIQMHLGYFYLELTQKVLLAEPEITEEIIPIFKGERSAASVQGSINNLAQRLKEKNHF